MSTLFAFLKKEWTEQMRTGRALLLFIVFALLGVMNPAIAKLTPWLMEMAADTMPEMGITVGEVSVDAMASWQQFFKNLPIGLIVFVLMQGGCFTAEYQSGTLIPVLTKGFARAKVVTAKAWMLFVLWSVCYWGCFGITYGYNAYFWDNGVADNLPLASVAWWLFGMLVLSSMIFFSTLLQSTSGVLLGTGAVALLPYLLGMIPRVGRYLPSALTGGMSLLSGAVEADAYLGAFAVTGCLLIAFLAASYPAMQKRSI